MLLVDLKIITIEFLKVFTKTSKIIKINSNKVISNFPESQTLYMYGPTKIEININKNEISKTNKICFL